MYAQHPSFGHSWRMELTFSVKSRNVLPQAAPASLPSGPTRLHTQYSLCTRTAVDHELSRIMKPYCSIFCQAHKQCSSRHCKETSGFEALQLKLRHCMTIAWAVGSVALAQKALHEHIVRAKRARPRVADNSEYKKVLPHRISQMCRRLKFVRLTGIHDCSIRSAT